MAQVVDACGRGPHCCEFESRPEHHRLVAQYGRGNVLRPRPVSVRIRPSLPCARSPTAEAAASRAVQCWFESSRAHRTSRLPMVRLADSKPAIGCSNHAWGATVVESRILRLADFGLARKRLLLLYLRFQLSGSNSVVECQLPKLDVTGSSPVSRSIF